MNLSGRQYEAAAEELKRMWEDQSLGFHHLPFYAEKVSKIYDGIETKALIKFYEKKYETKD